MECMKRMLCLGHREMLVSPFNCNGSSSAIQTYEHTETMVKWRSGDPVPGRIPGPLPFEHVSSRTKFLPYVGGGCQFQQWGASTRECSRLGTGYPSLHFVSAAHATHRSWRVPSGCVCYSWSPPVCHKVASGFTVLSHRWG